MAVYDLNEKKGSILKLSWQTAVFHRDDTAERSCASGEHSSGSTQGIPYANQNAAPHERQTLPRSHAARAIYAIREHA